MASGGFCAAVSGGTCAAVTFGDASEDCRTGGLGQLENGGGEGTGSVTVTGSESGCHSCCGSGSGCCLFCRRRPPCAVVCEASWALLRKVPSSQQEGAGKVAVPLGVVPLGVAVEEGAWAGVVPP